MNQIELNPQKVWLVAVGICVVWSLLLGGAIWSEKKRLENQTMAVANAQAEAYFERDITMRQWAADIGGLYAPVSERTEPNPYLAHIFERDLMTPSGRDLTLMNPAYMVRQLNEDMAALGGVKTRITSLNPLRPQNAPDAWETMALQALEKGADMFSTKEHHNNGEQLRVMKPLFVKQPCLKCHAHQGYQVGDLRGGVAVSIPLERLNAIAGQGVGDKAQRVLTMWVLGLGAILAGSWILVQGLNKQRAIADKLAQEAGNTEAIIHNLPVPVVLVGKDKVVRQANRAAMQVFGKKENEVVGKPCHNNICPAMENKCPVLDLGQELDNTPRKALDGQGQEQPILKTVIPFSYKGEEILLEAFVDVSKQHLESEKLQATVDELRRFNKLAVGREQRIAELKEEVNSLLAELGRDTHYRGKVDSLASVGDDQIMPEEVRS